MLFDQLEESGVVLLDVLSALSFGPDEFAVGASVLVDGDFETASSAGVWVKVVDKLAGHGFFDLLDRCSSMGSVASAAAVFDLHDVWCVLTSGDGFHILKLITYH